MRQDIATAPPSPQGDIWPCLVAFLVDTTEGEGLLLKSSE